MARERVKIATKVATSNYARNYIRKHSDYVINRVVEFKGFSHSMRALT